MRYFFGGYRLDTERRELRRGDAPVALEPQVFDLLVYLLQNRDRVVSKDDLLARVWGGRIVSDATIDSRIKAARQAIGDSGAAQGMIRTFARKGVRFVAAVEEEHRESTALSVPPERLQQLPVLTDKPSIAVLPFRNLNNDSEQEYFADGMVEEIINALSRIRWLFVMDRNSSFTYKGQRVEVKRVGRELDVRYILEGSVRKTAGRVRIAAQLIDASTGAHLWTDRFDGSLEDIFDIQDRVAISVAGAIEPTLQAAEIRRSTERPTCDLTAYDLYLRALSHVRLTYDRDSTVQALKLLARAIEIDPRFGSALAQCALCHVMYDTYGWADDREANRQRGVDFARRALRVAEDDPFVLAYAGFALGRLGEDIDAAVALVNRALELNPSFARGWHWAGWLSIQAGNPSRALKQFETSSRLSPHDQRGMNLAGIGAAHFFNQRFEDAAANLVISLQHLPDWAVTYRFLVSCYWHMGRIEEARKVVERLRTITPVIVPTALQYRNPEHRQLFLTGLRLAAGETT